MLMLELVLMLVDVEVDVEVPVKLLLVELVLIELDVDELVDVDVLVEVDVLVVVNIVSTHKLAVRSAPATTEPTWSTFCLRMSPWAIPAIAKVPLSPHLFPAAIDGRVP